jgi:tetratricopeptide (TPR) repeat protein
VWSENAAIDGGDGHRANLHMIQHLAATLDIQMSAERLAATARTPDLDLDIHDRWLRGNELLSRWLPADERRAEAIFRSIARDAGDFAPAHASLAQILGTRHQVFPGLSRDRDREHEALRLAHAAAKLAPMDSRTMLTLALSYLMNDKHDQAIYYYDLALQMNDNDPRTLLSAAL